jgi:hypothetical protein
MVNTWDRGDGHSSVFSFFQVLHKNQGRKSIEGKEEKGKPEPSRFSTNTQAAMGRRDDKTIMATLNKDTVGSGESCTCRSNMMVFSHTLFIFLNSVPQQFFLFSIGCLITIKFFI